MVETLLNSEPTRKTLSADFLKIMHPKWFETLRAAREEQFSTEHKFLIEFSYFALREMEAGGRVLPETIEIIRERTARVGLDFQKACDAKTFDELFPK